MKPNTQTQPLPKVNQPPALPPNSSWAEKVKISESSTRFQLDPIPRRTQGGQLCIPEEMLLDNLGQWNRCMVGFIPGFKMSHRMVNTIASRVWRSCGLEQVTTMNNGFMLFRFKTEAEMQAVMERGPWLFGGKAILLQQWYPGYKFDKNRISKLPVWIRLHGLPFPLWSQAGLSLAASMVGRPLSCDSQTYNCQRLEFARLCVEIDAALPKVSSFEVVSPLSSEPITVEVEYEWLPPHCQSCKLYGHSCKRGRQAPLEGDVLNTVTPPIPSLLVNDTLIAPASQTNPPQPSYSKTCTTPTEPLVPSTQTVTPKNPTTQTVTPKNPTAPITKVAVPQILTAPLVNKPIPQKHPSVVTDVVKVGKEPLFKDPFIPPEGTSKYTAVVTFGNLQETCHTSKMDSLGSHSIDTFEREESPDESSASIAPMKDQESPPFVSPKAAKKKKGGKNKKLNPNGWDFLSNATVEDKCRILIGWNPMDYRLTCIHSTSQWITCAAVSVATSSTLIITFVYGLNTSAERMSLWDYLINSTQQFSNMPWILLGDFNTMMYSDQKVGGDSRWLTHHEDFQKAAHQAQLIPLPYKGMKYTWSNGQPGHRNIQEKLDWALGNSRVLQDWPDTITTFLPRSISDHCAIILQLNKSQTVRPSQFKFINAWTSRDDYLPIISSAWQMDTQGNPIRRLLTKLQRVKAVLKTMHRNHTSNISARVSTAKLAWDQAQQALDLHPRDVNLLNCEREAAATYGKPGTVFVACKMKMVAN
ncbi:hypothetical protein OIU84_023947 [Salix udensis]|uniref:DUF4283 domain-containing protein n=1 Tax=Salix udensis TaxID=889485 RepID=A0AAD6KHQ5_9ROSI|nr:hypothetical protein OIU84_023947 [Salix udensis]